MKFLGLLIIPVLAFGLRASAQNPDQTGQTTSAATAISRVAAEFTGKIDSKDAKVGDAVAARTTASASLADGTELPKGTRLAGTVSYVHARSSAENTARLVLTLNRAILQDGREIPLHVTLTSLSAIGPATAAAAPGSPEVMAAQAATGPGGRLSSGTGAGTGTGLGGGLSGASVRGSSRSTGGVAAGTTSGIDAMPVQPLPVRTGLDDPRAEGSSASGNYVSDALAVHHYPVGNMPGVILSSQATASVSGVLDASGQNIRIDSGTRMTLNASLAAR